MFGKRPDPNQKRDEQIWYEQTMKKARELLSHADKYPEIRKSATREAREHVQHEQALQEARELLRATEPQRNMQTSARKHLQAITKGLHHDAIEPDKDLMQRLARMGAEEYMESHHRERLDPHLVSEVFETEYQEALETKTFFNPFTGEIEPW